MAHILASMEGHVGNTALIMKSLPSLGYELSLGTSFAKINRDGCILFYV